MNWLTLSIAGGCLLHLLLKGRAELKRKAAGTMAGEAEATAGASEAATPEPPPEAPPEEPQQTQVDEDPVQAALDSGELDKLLGVADQTASPLDRHRVLKKIIEKTYPLRHEAQMGEIFVKFARAHFESAPEMIASLKAADLWDPKAIVSAKLLAIALEQEGLFDEAIDICRRALALDLEDGTKTGYEGRIHRLENKKSD